MQCYFEKKSHRYNFLFKNKQKQAKMDFELKKLIFDIWMWQFHALEICNAAEMIKKDTSRQREEKIKKIFYLKEF